MYDNIDSSFNIDERTVGSSEGEQVWMVLPCPMRAVSGAYSVEFAKLFLFCAQFNINL